MKCSAILVITTMGEFINAGTSRYSQSISNNDVLPEMEGVVNCIRILRNWVIKIA